MNINYKLFMINCLYYKRNMLNLLIFYTSIIWSLLNLASEAIYIRISRNGQSHFRITIMNQAEK